MVHIQSATAENSRGKKRRRKIETTAAKYNGRPITMGGHKQMQFIRLQQQIKNCKNHKKVITQQHIDIQVMWYWVISPFYDFCGFWSVVVTSCTNCSVLHL